MGAHNGQQQHRVGIVGVSGYGGGEILRFLARHPNVTVSYVAGESSAGKRLADMFPGLDGPTAELIVQSFAAEQVPADLDLIFLSLPTGESKAAAERLPRTLKVIDVGGDHRWQDGWVYGLTEVLGAETIARANRVADPGCFPAASLLALAPLVANGLIEPTGIVVDAKTGISGAGRGGGSTFGYAEVNEDVAAYNLLKHAHQPEMRRTVAHLAGREASLVFTPHLVPMTRGIVATCYGRGTVSTDEAMKAARSYYAEAPFVRVMDRPPHSKWAQGSNLAFLSYAADPDAGIVIAIGAIDNLGKGAAGQAVQNMNLMLGYPETTGLDLVPMLP
jgi:N-acetyl-gamma-glutamyl-phosphate reductase